MSIPGLKENERSGTYFSLLPRELRQLLEYYYVFPIRVWVAGGSLNNDNIFLSLQLSRNGVQLIDNVLVYIDIIEFLKNDGHYNDKKVQFWILKPDELGIHMSKPPDDIYIYYNKYETSQLKAKLNFILSQINKYKTQNLSSTVIIKKIRYAY